MVTTRELTFRRWRPYHNLGSTTDARGMNTLIVDAHYRKEMPSGENTMLPGTASYSSGRGESKCSKCTKNRIQHNISQVTKEQQTRIKMRESRIARTKVPDLYFCRRTNRGQTLRVDCWSRKTHNHGLIWNQVSNNVGVTVTTFWMRR